jgi:hypothetical protein
MLTSKTQGNSQRVKDYTYMIQKKHKQLFRISLYNKACLEPQMTPARGWG